MSEDRTSIYNAKILDHYRNPRNQGKLANPDLRAVEVNPTCGDQIKLELKVKNNRVSQIKFSGQGCALSMAASSILTEMVSKQRVEKLSELNLPTLINEMEKPHQMREQCISLPLNALLNALAQAETNSG